MLMKTLSKDDLFSFRPFICRIIRNDGKVNGFAFTEGDRMQIEVEVQIREIFDMISNETFNLLWSLDKSKFL